MCRHAESLRPIAYSFATRIIDRESFAKQGADPAGGTPDDYEAFMRAESARWREVVKQAGIKPE